MPEAQAANATHRTTLVKVAVLKAHPRNYRSHPADQIAHIKRSIVEHGFYRNVVIANDQTILAGHGVVQAATELGVEKIPVIALDIASDDPRALKILTGDNEISERAEVDDRLLSELLREILHEADGGLDGTGYDEQMLAALVLVTRPEGEIASFSEAAEWVGMPEYENEHLTGPTMIIAFLEEADRERLWEMIGKPQIRKKRLVWSTWWPPRPGVFADPDEVVEFVNDDAAAA